MLILTRRPGETILIDGQEIQVTILGVKGNQAKIGVSAPKHMSVHREEVFDKIAQEGPRNPRISDLHPEY